MDRIRYPKTMHFSWSPGLKNDDRVIESLDGFDEKEIVITQKMDGENTTMYRDAIHARSLEVTMTHPSRAWVRALHGSIKHDIPEGFRICGENLYAEHSIHYDNLPSYFMVFSIWNDKNECLSWAETKEWAELLGLTTVPVVWEGPWNIMRHRQTLALLNQSKAYSEEKEGYVVRIADKFHYDDFNKYVAKYVRRNHVQTDEHWTAKEIITNGIIREQ